MSKDDKVRFRGFFVQAAHALDSNTDDDKTYGQMTATDQTMSRAITCFNKAVSILLCIWPRFVF